jgi:predicted AlkP superfamily phosphohydrolase/phosphomutase
MVSWSHELVDWSKTRVWSDGGYYARIFLNVRGREPQGVIEPDQVEAFRQEIIDKLGAMPDHRGTPMGNVVFRPENIYRETRNVPPDLIVYFGNLAWRSVGSVGGGNVYTFENDTGPDDANHAQFGIFIMTGDGIAPGERTDLKITDVGPTVMHRMGLPVPDQMIGKVIA